MTHVRNWIGNLLGRTAIWSTKLSYLIGGLMGISTPIALLDGLFGSGHRNWPDPFGGAEITALGAAWRAAILMVLAYVVLYLLLPTLLSALAWRVYPRATRDFIVEIVELADD